MIIGSGLVAQSLQNIDTKNILFFASGVSNSLETRSSEFEREFSLLKKSIENNPQLKFIYFSTLSIKDRSKQSSPYVLHKLEIENYIKKNTADYLILRIGNVVGKGGNPNTLFNFLKEQINNKTKFTLHSKARRLLIDIDDIPKFLELSCNYAKNQTINCAFPYYYDLKEIINAIESETGKSANFTEVNEGDFYLVDFDDSIQSFFSKVSPEEYLKVLTEKYIKKQ